MPQKIPGVWRLAPKQFANELNYQLLKEFKMFF
jgi:hypothetical protein